jgi:hypothetical protein
MAEAATNVVQGPATAAAKHNRAIVFGRVKKVRRNEDVWYTHVVLPAADEFSSPGQVELISDERIADKDETVKILVRLDGFEGRPFKVTDKETGEVRTVRPVVNRLRVLKG